MECNKEEAIRAKEMAERKMQNGDYDGAQKIAKKAQQLYPEVDNISQLLLVCEVHCSAQNKANGSEMDWYEILQIGRFSDESVIKRQYKKLAFLLHPDKNKFAGAEAAFKLICEANRVLTDATKRPLYDMKLRCEGRPVVTKAVLHKSSRGFDAKKQYGLANRFTNPPFSQYMTSHTYQQPSHPTFWTCCQSCDVKYEYLQEFQNKVVLCENCKQNFIAQDFDIHGVTPLPSWSQFVDRTNGPCHVSLQNRGEKPSGACSLHGFTLLDPVHEPKKAVNVGQTSKLRETKAQSAVEKTNRHVDVEARNSVSVPMSDTAKSRNSGTSEFGDRKRGRKLVPEASGNHVTDSSDSEDDVVSQENQGYDSAQYSASSGYLQSRRSSRQKQHVIYKENLIDDDFVSPATKRSRGNGASGSTVKEMKECVSGVAAKEENSGGSAAAAADDGRKKIGQKPYSSLEESSSNKNSKAVDNKEKGEGASMMDKSDKKSKVYDEPKLKSNEGPWIFECPEPDFSNFDKDKAENCFAVNQLWAAFDDVDGMPRFYAWIERVHSPRFKLQITWLEASPENNEKDGKLPLSCGKFEKGETQSTENPLIFSHQMHCIRGRSKGTYIIYPKKGETWALFKDWDMTWSSEPEKHRPPYQYEIVEIVTDPTNDNGIGVAYLGKVRGFVSIFKQTASDGVLSFCIPTGELFRFSHRIPSFRMTGKEGIGVPAGSLELDPASLPRDLVNQGEPGGMETKNLDIGTSCLDSKPTKNEMKRNMHSKMICTPRKKESGPRRGTPILRRSPREFNGPRKNDARVDADKCGKENGSNVVSPGNLAHPEGIGALSQANQRIQIPKKWRTSELVAEAIEPRRSPRDINKESSKVKGRQFVTDRDTDKHKDSETDGSCGRMDSLVEDGRKSCSRSGRMVIELAMYDFRKEKLIERFQLHQIWAMYSDKDGMPRNYAQVKKIESAPQFRMQVAMLESCFPPKDGTQFLACGTFTVKNGEPIVASPAEFSHQLKAEIAGKNRFEVYPRKGEVWAVHKNWNSESAYAEQGNGECDMVEVLKDTNQSIKVVVLMRVNASKPFYRGPISSRVKAGILDIPRSELGRFSHQCHAFLHLADKDRRLDIWEIDSSSIPGNVIIID